MGGVQLRRRLLARGNFRLLPAGDGLLLPGENNFILTWNHGLM